MPKLRPSALLGLLLAFCSLMCACRDEQAGPRPRGAPAAAGGQQGSAAGHIYDQVPPLQFQSGATLGGGSIRYLGSRFRPMVAQPGAQQAVAHYFQVLKPPPSGYGFFTHVVDAQTGQMLVNADHEFQGGSLPLERWPVNKVVEDIHTFTVPEGASGTLRLLLGFWRGDERLAVDQPQGHDGTNRLIGPAIAVASAQLPEYHARRTASAPTIDGDLGDRAWSKAEAVTLVSSLDGSPASHRTVARVLYDDRFLYVSFDVEDPDVWGTLLKRDDSIYTEDVVEIFLDANADLKTYNELEVSPNNTIFDAYFPARRQGMDLSWDSGMTSAVKVQGTLNDASDRDRGFTVEMRIPMGRLAEVPHLPPRPGDRWRFNLYRLNNRTNDGQAFSPLYIGDFHNLPRFGWLVFD